jgi:putative peptidoglycan lipid II flippase
VAMNFYFLPIAVAATPVALAVLPHLSRLHLRDEPAVFRDTLTRGYALALFAAIPAAVGYLVLAGPLADAVTFGKMEAGAGSRMIEISLQAVSLGIVGQTMFMIATYASYAREDTRAPLRAMRVQAIVCVGLTAMALMLDGTAVLVVIGCAWSLGSLAGAAHLHRQLRRDLPRGTVRLAPRLLRVCVGAAVMAVVVWVVQSRVIESMDGRGGSVVGVLAATLAGIATFVATQAALRSPELAWLLSGVGRRDPEPEGQVTRP